MKTSGLQRMLVAGMAVALVLGLGSGCSDSDSDGDSGGQALNVAGAWSLTSEGIFPMTLNLTHTGTTVGGNVADAENYARRITGTTVSPAGSTSGSRGVTLVVTYSDGMVATFAGTVSANNNSMSGRYTTNWAGEGAAWNARRN